MTKQSSKKELGKMMKRVFKVWNWDWPLKVETDDRFLTIKGFPSEKIKVENDKHYRITVEQIERKGK